ncbi:hypothetical protein [Roseiarcus sp.]|uniref:hypothetical protein n=1 Tax=Roseiarcus sp. TaxID=1969460 RepID=UPI003F9A759D
MTEVFFLTTFGSPLPQVKGTPGSTKPETPQSVVCGLVGDAVADQQSSSYATVEWSVVDIGGGGVIADARWPPPITLKKRRTNEGRIISEFRETRQFQRRLPPTNEETAPPKSIQAHEVGTPYDQPRRMRTGPQPGR